jgi:adenylate cyclase
MGIRFWRNFIAIQALLLLHAFSACAVSDTLGYIGSKHANDTTGGLDIFRKFTWNMHATFTNGTELNITTTRPDTVLRSNNLSELTMDADFYPAASMRNKILTLFYKLEGSLKLSQNGVTILETGKFSTVKTKRNLIQTDYADILFIDTLQHFKIRYIPFVTHAYELSIELLEKDDSMVQVLDDINDKNDDNRKGYYYLAFCIVFLAMFVYHRDVTENLYFALFCLFASLSFLLSTTELDILYNVESFAGVYAFEFLSIFFCKILKNKEKSKIPLLVITGALLVCLLPALRYNIQPGMGGHAPWGIVATYVILYGYTWISTLYYLVQGIGQKRWEARAVLLFCLVPIIAMLVIGIILLFAIGLDTQPGKKMDLLPTMFKYLSNSIVYLYPLAAVVILGRRNGQNQIRLQAQVKSIEQLSEENLIKEREKKEILEGQKESLERDVALRTKEILLQKEQIELQHEELKVEKEKSDELLRNILPEEIAAELKATGSTPARHYDNVTVLFTDFVNFTKAGEQMSPQRLIDELHSCFKAFDEITSKYGIEKIKTIGDAYLAVAGLPKADPNHAEHAVRAALEMNAFMERRLIAMGNRHTFAIRIGVHSGSVVAGIVGVKKFAYDIWGDAVNTAARMEQSGVAGRVNVSEATYELLKDKYKFEYRGKIEAKNKGAMDMYFVWE